MFPVESSCNKYISRYSNSEFRNFKWSTPWDNLRWKITSINRTCPCMMASASSSVSFSPSEVSKWRSAALDMNPLPSYSAKVKSIDLSTLHVFKYLNHILLQAQMKCKVEWSVIELKGHQLEKALRSGCIYDLSFCFGKSFWSIKTLRISIQIHLSCLHAQHREWWVI